MANDARPRKSMELLVALVARGIVVDVGIQGHGDDPAAEKDGRGGQHVVREQHRNVRYVHHLLLYAPAAKTSGICLATNRNPLQFVLPIGGPDGSGPCQKHQ